ncbi:MAG: PEP-CTERM sorting domain-containing protein [Fimbriimonadaceae bacterium]|nr:PEP-CTERM sorting domain-containing protein [Fimbriimonadaceae bacterium]
MKFVNAIQLFSLFVLSVAVTSKSQATIINGDFATDLSSWTSTPAGGTTWQRDPNAPAPGSGFARIAQGANFKPTDPFDCGENSTHEYCTVSFRYRTHNNGDQPNPLRITGSGNLDRRLPASNVWTNGVVFLGFCGPNKVIQFTSVKGQVDIDDVVDSCMAVPEPGSMLATGTGVASLIGARMRKRR